MIFKMIFNEDDDIEVLYDTLMDSMFRQTNNVYTLETLWIVYIEFDYFWLQKEVYLLQSQT